MKSNGFAEEDTLKHRKVVVDSSLVDDAAIFISSDDEELLDPAAAAKVRAKIDRHLLPLMLGECESCIGETLAPDSIPQRCTG
jgi:hypothetical protein